MDNKSKQQYLDFEAYERVAEPHKRERASVWRTAIGLQDVDGLKVSDYLKETAVRHIEGDITIDDVREQLKSYYVNKTTHDEDDAEKEEADRVAANIAKLLNEQSFSFTALEFLNIHRHLFEGVFKHAGKLRPYDISKKEWVLRGDSVVYGRAADIMMALRYDIQQEKDFSYKGLNTDEIIDHIVDFVTLRRQNGDKARTGRFLGRSSRPTHHRDAKEGRRLSRHAHGLIDHNHPLLPFDKDLANRVASITIGADSAAPCPSDRGINQNKFIHRINFYENYNIAIFQGIIQPLETFRSPATRVATHPRRPGIGADQP